MSEDDFLSRWSRRKREVAAAEKVADNSAAKVAKDTVPGAENAPKDAVESPKKEVDLSALPPIESITSLTDITGFLQAGVPADLTRAALRRVWTTDPAIRDFVGLAENAWDFTDPNAMPGFGPLEATDDVKRMIASIVEKIGEAADAHPTPRERSVSDSNELSEIAEDEQPTHMADTASAAEKSSQDSADAQVLLQGNKVDSALQHDAAESKEASLKSSRPSHGGALPR